MLPLTGYTDRFSAAPGGRIEFKISSALNEPYQASLVRIIHGDPNPAGPGLKYEDIAAEFSDSYPSRHQSVHLGSYAIIPNVDALNGLGAFTIGATIWPTLPTKPQAVLSRLDDEGLGFILGIGPDGVILSLISDEWDVTLRVGKAMRRRAWYRIHARVDIASGSVSVSQCPLAAEFGIDDAGESTETAQLDSLPSSGGPLLIGARGSSPVTEHFNGKIERPFIVGRLLNDDELLAAFEGVVVDKTVAAWDFSKDVDSLAVRDLGPHGLDGALINLPARAMKGSNWSGREMSWRHASEEYGAIHFHEDDLYDCAWQTDFVFEVPDDCPSGVYGARLRCQDIEEIIPFYIRPKTGAPRSDVVFLASTFTFQVYANHIRGNADHAYIERARAWGAREWNPDHHPDYGASTYNFHSDGSGICYSSRLRPIITMRPGFLTFFDPRGSGLRLFSADSHILDGLEARGHGFDVVTD